MAKKLPIVTIVGRRNVGKSTLFNALIKERRAIVDSHPGLTRDVISYIVTHDEVTFTLSDTPGLDLPESEELSSAILDAARGHLSRSSVIILLLEYPAPDSYDSELAGFLRKLSIPTIAAVNKMDSGDRLENMAYFYEIGLTEILPVSALRRSNLDLLMDRVMELLPKKKKPAPGPDLSISIVGRPNSGKSTLLNAYLGYNRAVVSGIPGTTRDSVDEEFTFHGKPVSVIDTAGVRKKSRVDTDVERYSMKRTIDSINRCDVVIHLIDAEAGLTDTDKKISDEILKARKPIIIAINKWDAIEKDHKTFDAFREKLIFRFYRAEDFPIISISAEKKQRIHRLIEQAFELKERASRRIETPRLNRVIADIQGSHRIPQLGHKLRIYYATQTDTVPPRFRLFVNNPELFRKDTIRYFQKTLQSELGLEGVPIVLSLEGKKNRKKR